MPRTLLRLLVICLLAIALPLQGVAAATMRHGEAAPGAGAQAAHPAARHEDVHAHCHAGRHAMGHSAHAKSCGGTCASSCCSPAALPTLPVVPAPAASPRPMACVAAAPTPVFVTGGPERPPRAGLA